MQRNLMLGTCSLIKKSYQDLLNDIEKILILLMSLEFVGALTLSTLIYGKFFFNGGVCKLAKDLTGKTIIITGASSGLGYETTRLLAKMNPTIIMACRNEKKSLPLLENLRKETNNQNIHLMKVDVADLDSIESFSEEYKSKYNTLDILINNAGLAAYERELTKDGFEKTFMTNYLGHYYLSNLLLDPLKTAKNSRIISISSMLYKKGTIKWDDINYEKSFNVSLL